MESAAANPEGPCPAMHWRSLSCREANGRARAGTKVDRLVWVRLSYKYFSSRSSSKILAPPRDRNSKWPSTKEATQSTARGQQDRTCCLA